MKSLALLASLALGWALACQLCNRTGTSSSNRTINFGVTENSNSNNSNSGNYSSSSNSNSAGSSGSVSVPSVSFANMVKQQAGSYHLIEAKIPSSTLNAGATEELQLEYQGSGDSSKVLHIISKFSSASAANGELTAQTAKYMGKFNIDRTADNKNTSGDVIGKKIYMKQKDGPSEVVVWTNNMYLLTAFSSAGGGEAAAFEKALPY